MPRDDSFTIEIDIDQGIANSNLKGVISIQRDRHSLDPIVGILRSTIPAEGSLDFRAPLDSTDIDELFARVPCRFVDIEPDSDASPFASAEDPELKGCLKVRWDLSEIAKDRTGCPVGGLLNGASFRTPSPPDRFPMGWIERFKIVDEVRKILDGLFCGLVSERCESCLGSLDSFECRLMGFLSFLQLVLR